MRVFGLWLSIPRQSCLCGCSLRDSTFTIWSSLLFSRQISTSSSATLSAGVSIDLRRFRRFLTLCTIAPYRNSLTYLHNYLRLNATFTVELSVIRIQLICNDKVIAYQVTRHWESSHMTDRAHEPVDCSSCRLVKTVLCKQFSK